MTVPSLHTSPPPPGLKRRLRVALYSHDTMGLGHIRRNLGIAAALRDAPSAPEILLVSGAREASAFRLPQGVDCLTLPALHKAPTGGYGARSLSTSLDELVELRSHTIGATLRTFRPDVLIVDKVARGAFGELEPALDALAARGDARVVLGLREVLDDPVTTREEWDATATSEALDEFYDAVWVYGDPHVYDPIAEYALERIRPKVHYTGYLAPPAPAASVPSEPPFALCLLGGGQDGQRLATAFLEAELPPAVRGLVVAGPYMAPGARAQLDALAATRPDRAVIGFLGDVLPLVRAARCVVGMGGYNTTVELLAHSRRALIVPRVRPRLEQLIRAERLARMGAVDVLHPDDLTAERLSRWCSGALTREGPRPQVDLAGRDRLPQLLKELVEVALGENILT